MLKRKQLNQDGFEYIKEQLSLGRFLANRLLGIPLEKGIVYTYLPPKLYSNECIIFPEGIKFLTGEKVIMEFEEIAIRLISNYLDMNPMRLAIFETLNDESDPTVEKKGYQHFVIDNAVYDYIRGSDELKPIWEYIHDARQYPTVFILANSPEVDTFFSKLPELGESSMNRLSEIIDYILIGAFDLEGYLFWCKES